MHSVLSSPPMHPGGMTAPPAGWIEDEFSDRSRNTREGLFCTGCGSYDVRPSYSTAKIIDRIAGYLSRRPFRCRCCRRRFYARAGISVKESAAGAG